MQVDNNKGLLLRLCRICFALCSSEDQLRFHLKSQGHATKISTYKKLYFVDDKNPSEECSKIQHHDVLETQQPILEFDLIYFNLQCCINVLRQFQDSPFNIHSTEADFCKFILSEITKNHLLFENFIKHIRKSDPSRNYSNEEIDASFDEVLCSNGMENDFMARTTTGDGNCFYRAVSYIFFSDEKYYLIIKFCCIFLLYEYRYFFQAYLKETMDTNGDEEKKFIRKICYYATDNSYADECSYLLLAILLDKPVYDITANPHFDGHMIPSIKIFCNKNKKKDPIFIGYKSQHMVSILKRNAESEIRNHNYIKFYEISEILRSNFKLNLYNFSG